MSNAQLERIVRELNREILACKNHMIEQQNEIVRLKAIIETVIETLEGCDQPEFADTLRKDLRGELELEANGTPD